MLLWALLATGCSYDSAAEFTPIDDAGAFRPAAAGGASGGEANGGNASNGGVTSGGSGGTSDVACAGVAAWSERAYVMGERATAVCKSPYSGLCEAGVEHEFECRPGAGVVGLGWCHDREPGVINGWQEAWILRARCAK